MSTILAPKYANLTTGYNEIKIWSIIYHSYNLTSKYFGIPGSDFYTTVKY